MRKFAQHGAHATEAEQIAARMLTSAKWPNVALTDKFCHYDLLVTGYDGRRIAIVEVKERNMEWGRYPTVHLSLTKIVRCLEAAENAGADFYFAVMCKTGLYLAHLNPEEVLCLPRKQGGRFDRGLAHDVETLVDIPITLFRRIDAASTLPKS